MGELRAQHQWEKSKKSPVQEAKEAAIQLALLYAFLKAPLWVKLLIIASLAFVYFMLPSLLHENDQRAAHQPSSSPAITISETNGGNDPSSGDAPTDTHVDNRTAFFARMTQCWGLTDHSNNPDATFIHIFLNGDGTVARPPRLSDASNNVSNAHRTALEYIRIKVWQCQPYELLPESGGPNDLHTLRIGINISQIPR